MKMGSPDDSEGATDVTDQSVSDISQEGAAAIVSVPPVVHESTLPKRQKRPDGCTLPPDDARLTYVKKYFGAINSGDARVVSAVMHEISIPKMVLVVRKQTANYYVPQNFEV